MQIKRRLAAVTKRFGPETDTLNQAIELNRICDRLEEIATYVEGKVERMKEREKTGMTLGQRQANKIQADRDRIARIHAEEAEELRKDQEQKNAQPEEADAGREPAEA